MATHAHDSKDKLVEFLSRRAFDPVLHASADKYHGAEKKKLENVQDATRAEKKRYANYGSAVEVKRMFQDDLNSEPAKKVHRELKQLDLPTLNDLKDEFLNLCEKEKVGD